MKLNQIGRLLALFAAMLFAASGLTAQDYCSSDGGSGYYDIYSIAFGDVVLNATGDDDGYGDYTDVLVDAEAGQDLTLALQSGGPWWQRYYWRVWVDFGNDGSFDGDLQDEVNGYFTQYATIHVPADFDGQARIRVNVSRHEYQGACAHYNTGEVEDYTLNVGESCAACAGTLYAVEGNVCFDGSATLTAVPNGDAVVPEGFSTVFVLTEGAGLVIENAGGEPWFTVAEEGNYTIHTLVYDPATLDLGIVELGVTTGFDVFGLITEGGGSICASLDVAGAPVAVEAPMAGTLSGGGEACLVDGAAMLTATPNGDISVPAGYSSLFVLTQGEGLTIVNAGAEPSFEVAETGLFTIHTLVYNPATLDLGIVEFGVTTGVDVFGLISEGGGAICASLDVAGAPFNAAECACQAFAGTMTADADAACFGGYTTISATANGDAVVPEGFSNIYVLTQGEGLTIVNAGAEPAFEVIEAGNYTIHSLVYDPATLDLGIVEFGVTTGFDVFGLITDGGGSICASLDVAGAPVAVENPDAGHIQAESFLNCFELGESTTLVGIPNGDAIVPDGYEVLYVLTQAWDLTILGVNTVPEFEVDSWNVYRIHTLVYNPATLDLSIVTIGETTGFDVFGLLVDGGGDVCASLDVPGALFFAWKPWICDFLGSFYHNMTVETQEVQLQKWMAAADSPEALERLLIEAAADVAVYPNPTVDVLNVELTGFAANQPVQVELHDVTGRVVMATAWNAGSTDRFELDLAAHKAGQYHLVLTQGNVRIHRQVVIMR